VDCEGRLEAVADSKVVADSKAAVVSGPPFKPIVECDWREGGGGRSLELVRDIDDSAIPSCDVSFHPSACTIVMGSYIYVQVKYS